MDLVDAGSALGRRGPPLFDVGQQHKVLAATKFRRFNEAERTLAKDGPSRRRRSLAAVLAPWKTAALTVIPRRMESAAVEKTIDFPRTRHLR